MVIPPKKKGSLFPNPQDLQIALIFLGRKRTRDFGQVRRFFAEDKAGMWPKLGNFLMGVANGLSIWWALAAASIGWSRKFLAEFDQWLFIHQLYILPSGGPTTFYRNQKQPLIWGWVPSLTFLNVPTIGCWGYMQLFIHMCVTLHAPFLKNM